MIIIYSEGAIGRVENFDFVFNLRFSICKKHFKLSSIRLSHLYKLIATTVKTDQIFWK